MAATTPRPRGNRNNSRGTLVGGIIALLIIIGAALLILWILDERREQGEGILGGDQPRTVSELLANPASFYGENVTVSGEVHEILNPIAFVISDPLLAEGEVHLLVIAPAPPAMADGATDAALMDHDVVQVTGILHQYDPALIEQELGATVDELQLQDLEGFEGQSVVIGEISGVTQRMTAGEGSQASVDEITSNPGGYYGEQVVVNSSISEVLSEQAFVLAGGLLVIDATGELTEGALRAASEVLVSGVVRELDSAGTVVAEYGITLDSAQVQQYEGGPVLIGEVITLIR